MAGAKWAALTQSAFVLRCALFAAMGGFLFGYDQGVISITLVMPHFNSTFPLVATHPNASFYRGLMTALLQLGAMLGAAQAGLLADRISRKRALFVGFAWFVVGSAIQTGSMHYAMLVVGRFIGGVGIGVLSMVAPLYISEIAPVNVRGALLVLEEWCIVCGICVAFYITYGTRHVLGEWSWRLPFILQIAPALVLMATIRGLPYSPRWLVASGRVEEARAALGRLRGGVTAEVVREWVEVRAEAEVEERRRAERHPGVRGVWRRERAKWADAFRGRIWKRTLVGMGLMFFQQFTGINALIYYSPSLFQALGLDPELQLTMSGVMNLAQLVGVTPAIFLLDRLGRRPLLVFGSAAMTACHIIVAVVVGRYLEHAWVGVAFILAYMFFFGLTWGPVPWAMPAELFPSSVRAKGVAMATISNWFNNFVIGLMTPPFVQRSPWGAFCFFAVFSALSGVWSWVGVPETKGRGLEEMDAVWGDDEGQRDRRLLDEVIARLEAEVGVDGEVTVEGKGKADV